MSVVGLEPRQMILRKVFQGLTQHMRDGFQLRQLVDMVNELNYHDAKQRHLFGQMYEEMLRIMQSSKETGEYYTPRAVTKFIVEQLDPKLGEKFGDFACGTGGFLTAAIDHLNAQGAETKKQVEQLQNAIVGCELKAIPYLLCATNMLVHGIDNPAITQGTAFSININDYDEKDKVDVVGMNPPYGGMTTSTELTNFPENVRTSETAVLFLAYIGKRLKNDGRAGVIIPDGFLFGSDNASVEVKKILLKEMNLHTVIRLPSSVFAPYTSITTNILFFDNKRADGAPEGFKTKDVWFYRMDMPEGYKHFSKTKPILPEHMQVVKDWWNNRVEIADPTEDPSKVTYKAKCYSAEDIAESGYNLDLCKYPKEEEVILTPDELLKDYHERRDALNHNIDKTLKEIQKLLGI
jgi:type I restriction enzyme M protein